MSSTSAEEEMVHMDMEYMSLETTLDKERLNKPPPMEILNLLKRFNHKRELLILPKVSHIQLLQLPLV